MDADTTPRAPSATRARYLALGTLVPLFYALVVNAWQADDAYITFRTVRNLWAGHGLTWNPGWRVQAYTHPLWMALTALGYGVTHEIYFTVLAIAIALGMVCGLRLLAYPEPPARAALAVLLFSASGAAIQYAVSGLENALLFVLLVEYVLCMSRVAAPLWQPALLVGLIGLTRLDALLLVLPSAGVALATRRPMTARSAGSIALALAPLWLWHVFSIVYYGVPFPNTALAKLQVEFTRTEIARQGLVYLLDSLRRDPITLLTTAGGAAWLLSRAGGLGRAHAGGALLYLVYVVWIGGDFMTGRFLGAPFVLMVAGWAAEPALAPRAARTWALACAGLSSFALAWPGSPWQLHFSRGDGPTLAQAIGPDGIADERGFYYRSTGLLHMLLDREAIAYAGLPMPPQVWAQDGVDFARASVPVTSRVSIGFFGFFAGDKPVIDVCGLADPLLARIPHCSEPTFRPGHCLRTVPRGYPETLVSGQNRLADPETATLYERVRLLAQAPLFAPERWRAIACTNLGGC